MEESGARWKEEVQNDIPNSYLINQDSEVGSKQGLAMNIKA